MSVHHAISQHSNNQHQHLEHFKTLDEQRESAIDRAIHLCLNGQSFSVDEINAITISINALGKKGISPQRKLVSLDMIQAYAEQIQNTQAGTK